MKRSLGDMCADIASYAAARNHEFLAEPVSGSRAGVTVLSPLSKSQLLNNLPQASLLIPENPVLE